MPLLVLTADRPPELRDVGAGQTIDQVKLYGSAAKWFFEVDDHPATPGAGPLAAPARLPRVLDRARGPARARAPELRAARAARARRAAAGRRAGRRRARRRAAVGHAPRPHRAARAGGRSTRWPQELEQRPRALLVAGRAERDPRLGAALAAFAERAGAAAAGRAASGARRGPAAIAHYDALLRDPAFGAARVPELVLRVGDLPTSKPLRQWLAGLGDDAAGRVRPRERVAGPGRRGGDAAARRPARADRRAGRARLPRTPRATAGSSEWTGAGPRRRGRDRGACSAHDDGLSEPRVAAELGVRLPAEATLVVASSMPSATSRRSSRCARRAAARAVQPRRERDRRHRLDRVRRRRRGAGAGRAADRRRRARCTTSAGCSRRAGSGCRSRSCCSTTTAAGSSTSCPSPARATRSRSTSRRRTGLDFAHAAALYGLDARARRGARAVPRGARRARSRPAAPR